MSAFLDWAFRSRETGQIVIGQWPNPAISVAAVAWLSIQLVDSSSSIGQAARVIAPTALGIWALDELLRGVNPWRRFLGLVALASVGVNLLA